MMKMSTLAYILSLILFSASFALSQTAAVGSRFPGLSQSQLEKLETAKKVTAIPLPTWLPAGFKAERILMKLGSRVPIEEKQLVIIYSRKLSNGKKQQFSIEGGFEGLGGLPYDVTKVVASAVGKLDLMYEPKDPDDGKKKIERFSMTEWFKVGKTDFHFDGMYGSNPDNPLIAMISLADTEKILRSLRRF